MGTQRFLAGRIIPLGIAVVVACMLAAGAGATGLNGDATYTIGPSVCGTCHPDQLAEWFQHGHSKKLAQGPLFGSWNGEFGLSGDARSMGIFLPDHDADVYNWNNILFVIGASKHWKTRYVGLDGYIITKGGKNQYNWQDGSLVDYHKDEVKPFDCGPCHTTGYRAEGTALAFLPGIVGDFAHLNVTCEACHGPGADHAANPSTSNITVDESAALCGRCHTRGDDDNIAEASGSFIRHHEQYPELLNSPHNNLTCGSCHDPHGTRVQGVAGNIPDGETEICAKCHSSRVTEYSGSAMEQAGVRCQDCHMGRATKSAIAKGPYEGDVWTHIFRINDDASYDMFNRDGEGNAVSAKNALSLSYACLRCHADRDQAWAAALGSSATDYHTIGK